MSILQVLSVFLLSGTLVKTSRILGVFPSPGYSQFILAEKLMTELVKKGHEVTVISPFEPKLPPKNYTTISTNGLIETAFDSMDLFGLINQNPFSSLMDTYLHLGILMTEYTLSEEKVQKLINSNTTFDLVIVEQFINEAHLGFAQHFKAPLIVFSSLGACEWTNDLVGNPAIPTYVPHTFIGFSTRMHFSQRLQNIALSLFDSLFKEFVIFPQQNKLLKKYFPNAPDLKDVMYNVSLVLLNSHPAVTDPFPLVPNMIEIGGFHVEPEPIPEEIKKILDESEQGVILFSMGSNLQSKDLPVDTRNQILEVFSKLKQNILWKFEDEDLPGQPKNLKIAKWLPQRAILSHSNTKVFISHCGLLSSTESIFYGIPLICIPIYGDQHMNAAVVEKNQIGINLSFLELNKKSLENALDQILNNKKYTYTQNAKARSRVLRDRPVKPLDLAIYWIEYVLRHRGAPYFRSVALDLKWYQRWMLDVLLFVVILIVVSFKIVCTTTRKIISIIFRKEHKIKKNKKQ